MSFSLRRRFKYRAMTGLAATVSTPRAGPVTAQMHQAAARSPASCGISSVSRPHECSSAAVSSPLRTAANVVPSAHTYTDEWNTVAVRP